MTVTSRGQSKLAAAPVPFAAPVFPLPASMLAEPVVAETFTILLMLAPSSDEGAELPLSGELAHGEVVVVAVHPFGCASGCFQEHAQRTIHTVSTGATAVAVGVNQECDHPITAGADGGAQMVSVRISELSRALSLDNEDDGDSLGGGLEVPEDLVGRAVPKPGFVLRGELAGLSGVGDDDVKAGGLPPPVHVGVVEEPAEDAVELLTARAGSSCDGGGGWCGAGHEWFTSRSRGARPTSLPSAHPDSLTERHR